MTKPIANRPNLSINVTKNVAFGRKIIAILKFTDFLNWDAKVAVKYFVPITVLVFPYPNIITLVTLILAVAGVLIMPNYLLVGVALFFIGRFLDNVDGEVARLTNKTSKFGTEFDKFTGAVSFVLLFLIMGSGWLAYFGAAGAVLSRYPQPRPVIDSDEESKVWLQYLPFSGSGALKYWILVPIALSMGSIDLWLQITAASYWIFILIRLTRRNIVYLFGEKKNS